MGSKSSSAPPPDPRLAEAQIRSMGIQDRGIEAILRQTEEFAPLQREQMRFGIDSARTAYGQAQEDRGWALGKRGQLDKAQAPLLEMATNYDEAGRRDAMMGEATADITQAYGQAREQGVRQMGRMGINPSSGRSAAFANQSSMSQALATASAGRKVSEAARAEGMQRKSNAVNMLSGYPSMAIGLTGNAAGFGASGLGMANAGLGGVNSGYGAAGGMAGDMGRNASNMYGIQQQAATAAAGQKGEMWGSILGAGATLGAAAFKFSDRRLKCDIVAAGADEATGLTLYEFSYKSDPSRRYVGVMADEVAQIRPEAVIHGRDGYSRVNYAALGIEMVELRSLQGE